MKSLGPPEVRLDTQSGDTWRLLDELVNLLVDLQLRHQARCTVLVRQGCIAYRIGAKRLSTAVGEDLYLIFGQRIIDIKDGYAVVLLPLAPPILTLTIDGNDLQERPAAD